MPLRRFSVQALLLLTAACTPSQPGLYRGGVLVEPGPLDVERQYSFRFVEKWRISLRWLSGPVEIPPCGFGSNAFRYVDGYGELKVERNAPLVEYNGLLHRMSIDLKDNVRLYEKREAFYGTDSHGEFEAFSSLCGHFFLDSYDGVRVYIVRPDPAKGTDEWIRGAKHVTINGLDWLRKTQPIVDWTGTTKAGAPTETWVLKIPETAYWMKIELMSSSGDTNKLHQGAYWYPEKHRQVVDLFHKIVESVRLEPISPAAVTSLITPEPGPIRADPANLEKAMSGAGPRR